MVTIAVSQGDLGPATRFTPGTRIEVLWTLHITKPTPVEDAQASPSQNNQVELASNESEQQQIAEEQDEEVDDNASDVWWPATVVGRTSRMHDLPKNPDEEDDVGSLDRLPVYEIRYDPMLPDFPNPELASVCILDDHCLLSCEENDSLPWRHFGSTWIENDYDDEKKDIPEGLKDLVEGLDSNLATMTEADAPRLKPEDSLTFANAFVEDLISKLTAKHKDELEHLPRSNQNAIVDRVIQIKASLVQKLAGCLEDTGKVSEEDAKRIVEELRSS
jgi:hypothetical protein